MNNTSYNSDFQKFGRLTGKLSKLELQYSATLAEYNKLASKLDRPAKIDPWDEINNLTKNSLAKNTTSAPSRNPLGVSTAKLARYDKNQVRTLYYRNQEADVSPLAKAQYDAFIKMHEQAGTDPFPFLNDESVDVRPARVIAEEKAEAAKDALLDPTELAVYQMRKERIAEGDTLDAEDMYHFDRVSAKRRGVPFDPDVTDYRTYPGYEGWINYLEKEEAKDSDNS